MLLSSRQKVSEKIVFTIGVNPGISFGTLYKLLTKQDYQVSEQAVFKELRILIGDSIVEKVKGRYFISIDWKQRFFDFADQLQSSNFNCTAPNPLLPSGSNKQTWHFNNLKSMKRFWSYSVHQLCLTEEDSNLFSWNPHPWFYYTMPEHQLALMKLLKRNKIRMYKILGSHGDSRDFFHSYWPKELVSWSNNTSKYHSRSQYYFSAMNKHIIEVFLPKKLSDEIANEFSTDQATNKKRVSNLLELEQRQAKTTLSIRHSPRAVRNHEKYFLEYFC